MPTPIPPDMLDLFDEPALGHLAYTTDAGQIVSFPLWVDHDGSRILASSPVGSKKGQAVRKRPQVAVSIVSTKTPWHWLSISGRVVEVRPDEGLALIDRMSHKYLGQPYERRSTREVFVIEIDGLRHSGTWGG
jgi:general stress protein 26